MGLAEVADNTTNEGHIDVFLEREPTSERALGEYELVQFPALTYVKMSQVRGEKNKMNEAMKTSIERTGLLNPIDVARLDHLALSEYIGFVNEVWGSHTEIEEFDEQRQPDGTYLLVIAGHSRHQAIVELQAEGRLPGRLVVAKIHEVTSPEKIIEIQLAENEHSQPPRERQAIAVVESYEWGLRHGKWKNQKDYLEKHNETAESSLSDALGFSNLPVDIRNFILKGHVSYTAGVELGRAAKDVRRNVMFKANIQSKEDLVKHAKLIEGRVLRMLVVETNQIANSKLNSTAAEKRIRSWRKVLQEEMKSKVDEQSGDDSESTTVPSLFELDLKTPEELLQEQDAIDKEKIKAFMRSYGRMPTSFAADLIQLNTVFVDQKFVDEVARDFEKSVTSAQHRVGAVVLDRAILPLSTQ